MYPSRALGHRLSAEQLSALEVLADAGTWGCTGVMLFAYGFRINLLIGLIRDGLATTRRETMRVGTRKVRAARVWITEAGQGALEEAADK